MNEDDPTSVQAQEKKEKAKKEKDAKMPTIDEESEYFSVLVFSFFACACTEDGSSSSITTWLSSKSG